MVIIPIDAYGLTIVDLSWPDVDLKFSSNGQLKLSPETEARVESAVQELEQARETLLKLIRPILESACAMNERSRELD